MARHAKSSNTADSERAAAIAAVRQFNRFYTRQIGVVNKGVFESQFSLAEARVIYELANRETPTATEIGKALGLDAGYVSRILRSFQRRRLIAKAPSAADGRQSLLRLTDQGRRTFEMLDARSRDQVGAMLDSLPADAPPRLIGAMHTIETVLGARPPAPPKPYILRPPQPGDMGWVIYRHGLLYAQEYGWSDGFEELAATIVLHFMRTFDPKRERVWIAEQDGEILGTIFLVRKSDTVAKLRLLLVEPKARGMGIGRRLVSECVRQARQFGYRKITLWTQANLTAARRLYEEAGFRLVKQEPVHNWGHDLVSETWELKL